MSPRKRDESKAVESTEVEFDAFDLDTLRHELLGGVAIIDKLVDDLRREIGALPDNPQGLAGLVMSDLRQIEEMAGYLGRVLAVYSHRKLFISLARLSKGITPSAMRRRIMTDEEEGIDRPEKFDINRDSDAIGPDLTRYEIFCREAGIHPWPSTVPLPSQSLRQLRKTPDYHPEKWEIHRADFYRTLLENHPDLRERHPFGPPGTPEPPAPDPRDDPEQAAIAGFPPKDT
jgi:hypothetical protein